MENIVERNAEKTRGRSLAMSIALSVVFALIAYLGFFALIVVDEIVLRTGIVSTWLPQPALQFLEYIYYPLIELVNWSGIA